MKVRVVRLGTGMEYNGCICEHGRKRYRFEHIVPRATVMVDR